MGIIDKLRYVGKNKTEIKLLTGEGQIKYIHVQNISSPGYSVYSEGSDLYNMFKADYPENVVEIPANCHLPDGSIDMTKVDFIPDKKNPSIVQVLLTSPNQ